MASSDIITEVEIQPDIQEVEIETIPVEVPCETVETTIEGEDGQPMIALQPLPEPGREEIILQTQEEIVGADPLSVYDQIPVPDNDIYVESSPGPSRKAAKKARKSGGTRFRASDHAIFGEMATETKTRKWEQKQVQIKTLEGEFSVTMWASGTDDGESTAPLALSFSLSFSVAFILLFFSRSSIFRASFSFLFLSAFPLSSLVPSPSFRVQRFILSLSFSPHFCFSLSLSLSLFPSFLLARCVLHAYGRVRTSGAMLRSILRRCTGARSPRSEIGDLGPSRRPRGPAGLTGRVVCFDRANAIMFRPHGGSHILKMASFTRRIARSSAAEQMAATAAKPSGATSRRIASPYRPIDVASMIPSSSASV